MKIIFCNNLLEPGKPDEDFAAEFRHAQKVGFDAYLMSLGSLREGDTAGALRKIPHCTQYEHII